MVSRLIRIVKPLLLCAFLLQCHCKVFGSRINLRDYGLKSGVIDPSYLILQRALDNYDSVIVPKNFRCIVTSTIRLNTNNALIGEDKLSSKIIINADQFRWEDVFNPAAFVNASTQMHTNSTSFAKANKNLQVINLTFELSGLKIYNMQSVIRLAGIENVSIRNCAFAVSSGNNLSHNAIIDLHGAYRRISIVKCTFDISTGNKRAGGGIWIQNTSSSDCSDVRVVNCEFNVDSKDEALAIYTTGSGKVSGVSILNNSFTAKESRETNVSVVSIFNNVSSLNLVGNTFSVNSRHLNVMDGVVRLGLYNTPPKKELRKITIDGNLFRGSNSNYIGIKGYSGDDIVVKRNRFKGRSKKDILFDEKLLNWRVL